MRSHEVDDEDSEGSRASVFEPPLSDVIREAEGLGESLLVITPNRRLSTRLSKTYDQLIARQNDRTVWGCWQFLPWDSFLAQLWEESQLHHWITANSKLDASLNAGASQPTPEKMASLLLSPLQEQLVWQRVVSDSEWGQRLLNSSATAKLAQEACRLIGHYHVSQEQLLPFIENDTEQLLAWLEQCEQVCAERGWLMPADLVVTLMDRNLSPSLARYDALMLYGFRYFSPLEEQFLNYLAERFNVKLSLYANQTTQRLYQTNGFGATTKLPKVHICETKRAVAKKVSLHQANHLTHEYQCAVAWAWQRLQAARQQEAPLPRVGIVVPNLDIDRRLIQRLIVKHCQPELVLDPVLKSNDARFESLSERFDLSQWVNLSGGISVWETPLLSITDLLLKLLKEPFDLDHFCQLLRSPFIGGAESESIARHAIERRLQQRQISKLKWCSVEQWLALTCGESDLLERVIQANRWIEEKRIAQEQRSLEGWSNLFREWLTIWGWPGQRTLSSTEYQMQSKWFEVQQQFIGFQRLDVISGDKVRRYSVSTALALLRQAGESLTFQSQSDDAPIQVLGLLEADGQTYDHLWVCGLHSEVWPQPLKPNPLLPALLQRTHHMPHASAEMELSLAKEILEDFRQATCGELVLSWPKQEDDRDLLPSPLLSHYRDSLTQVVDSSPKVSEFQDPWLKWAEEVRLEEVPEQRGERVPEGRAVAGGTGIIRDQGACPFRAYLRYRLGAQPLDPAQMGLTPAERGELLHLTLEGIWQELESHSRLMELDDDQMRLLITRKADEAIQSLLGERTAHFGRDFLALERLRMVRLSLAWLGEERNRVPFTIVALEKELVEKVEGIELRMRIDRVDQIDANNHLIVDYKSGRTSIKQWLDDSLEEPQLPLYCLLSTFRVAGIVFAEVRAKGNRFNALVNVESAIFEKSQSSIKLVENWDEQMAQWRQTIYGRIGAFKEGWAAVQPRDGRTTCQFCPYPTVCRINEKQALNE